MAERRLRRMVRGWKGLKAYLPFGETQLRQMVADGRLAPPMKIGPRAIAWFETDIAELQEKIEREQRLPVN